MAIKNIKKTLLFLIALVFLCKAKFVLALELQYPSILGFSLNDTSSFPDYAKYFFNFGVGVAGIISGAVIAFGGIYYLASFAKGKFTNEGKAWVKAGAYGLLIVVCSYLIAYTINPDLVFFKLGNLTDSSGQGFWGGAKNPGIKTTVYQEIPIGVLTENLLTRTMDCYAFNPAGNPVEGDEIKTDDNKKIKAPTFLDHDRIDCLAQLTDAIQKKSDVIAQLSDKIERLMNKCDCKKYGQCQDTCGGAKGCDDPQKQNCPGKCTGACVDGACKTPPKGPNDCCPKDSGVQNPKNKKVNLTVKELIEHGPIKVDGCVDTGSTGGAGGGTTSGGTINGANNGGFIDNGGGGADTNPTQYLYYNDKPGVLDWFVGKANALVLCQSTNSGKPGYCAPPSICNGVLCLPPDGGDMDIGGGSSCGKCAVSGQYMGLDEFRCPNPNDNKSPCSDISSYVEKEYKYKKKAIKVVDKEKWNKLNLIQQLTYLKEKLDYIKQKIEADKNQLDQAKTTLGSKQCYFAISYADLLKTYRQTNQNQNVIFIQKTFSDPETSKQIDDSKYCKGFNYANSSCMKKCNDFCPDTSEKAISAFQKCKKCDPNNRDCLKTQENCIEDKYLSRPCTQGPDTSQNFDQCVSSCQDDCFKICSNRFLGCSDEFKVCVKQCGNNSKCVGANASSCLFGSQGIQECASQSSGQSDIGTTKYCFDKAYLCKNGSDQYAGYADCINKNILEADKSSTTDKCPTDKYSASYFYNNPNCEKCPDPQDAPKPDSVCYNTSPSPSPSPNLSPNQTKTTQGEKDSCQSLCPEVAKCPASSTCPYCPCDKIDDTVKFSIPKKPPMPTPTPEPPPSCKNPTQCKPPAQDNGNGGNDFLLYNNATKPEILDWFISKAYAATSGNNNSPQVNITGPYEGQIPMQTGSNSSGGSSFGNGGGGSAGQQDATTIEEKILEYQIVGPQCNEYGYNDDPLTFYCQQDWINDPAREGQSEIPIGTERKCTKDGEVPVGQTVDDAEKWADQVIESINKERDDAQDILNKMMKAGKAKDTQPVQDYCKCSAKYESNKPVCKTDCNYQEWQDPVCDKEGNVVGQQKKCCCAFVPCQGNPCQQIMNYLDPIWNSFTKLKTNFVDTYITALKEPRSDILKMLSYSRKKTNDCSSIGNIYNSEERLFSCTRVEEDLMPDVVPAGTKQNPLAYYCYGQNMGNLSDQKLTNNWFCCQQYETPQVEINK